MQKLIRQVFSAFCVAMLALLIWRVIGGVWTPLNWGMFAVASVSCLLVFVNFVYVFNYSYAICVALSSALIWWSMPSVVAALMAGVGIAYGLRLFWFTWQRMHSESYAGKVKIIDENSAAMPLPIKLAIWFQCTLLHTFHLMALYFVAAKGVLTPVIVVGIAVMFAGTLIEALADAQKQAVKADEPDGLVIGGLFSRWRHPNYAGEILLHVGLIIAGLAAVNNLPNMLALIVAPLYIIILMISEAQRVDQLHAEKYGAQPEYENYRARSGSLLPGFSL